MKVNLLKGHGSSAPGAAAPKNEIIFMEAEGIQVFPQSNANGVLMSGDFVMKSGEKMITVYSTKSKTDASMETEGDEDMMSFKSKLVLQYPGNSLEVKEFVQYWTGKNIVAMHKACGENHYEVMGTPCAPLQLKSAKQDNNDGRVWTLTLEPFAKSGFVPKIYEGEVIYGQEEETNPVVPPGLETIPCAHASRSYYNLLDKFMNASDNSIVNIKNLTSTEIIAMWKDNVNFKSGIGESGFAKCQSGFTVNDKMFVQGFAMNIVLPANNGYWLADDSNEFVTYSLTQQGSGISVTSRKAPTRSITSPIDITAVNPVIIKIVNGIITEKIPLTLTDFVSS